MDLDYGIFHLPLREMTNSLEDVYHIWYIPIKDELVFQREVIDDNLHGVDCLCLIGFDDHDWDHLLV